MKPSRVIKYIVAQGTAYNNRRAKELYMDGINYHNLSLAKWIWMCKKGKNLPSHAGASLPCGYCFEYSSNDNGCQEKCPLSGTIKGGCATLIHSLDTLKNIIKIGGPWRKDTK